jgi:hypothetical protein
MCSNRTGDISEVLAAAWALKRGYEVFRNVSSVGQADLCIFAANLSPIKVDVKTATKRTGASNPVANCLTPSQRKAGVKRLWIVDMQCAGIDDGGAGPCSDDWGPAW